MLEYAAGEEPIDAYADAILAHDGYYEALDPTLPDRTVTAVADAIVARNRRLGDAVEPIVETSEREFWPAVRSAFDRDDAIDMVENAFPFTGVLRELPDAFVFEVRIDPGEVMGGPFAGTLPTVSVEYTEEAARAMRRAERRVIETTKRAVSAEFADE